MGHYDKTCLFVEDLSWATAGDSIPPLWDTPIGRVAPLICADLDYPEPIESAVSRGAEAIVFPTAWVAEPAPSATWTLRAAEYGVPIIAADLIGTDRGVVFSGGSCIIDRDAVVVASNDYAVGLVLADIEMGPTRPLATPGVRNPDIHRICSGRRAERRHHQRLVGWPISDPSGTTDDGEITTPHRFADNRRIARRLDFPDAIVFIASRRVCCSRTAISRGRASRDSHRRTGFPFRHVHPIRNHPVRRTARPIGSSGRCYAQF